MMCCYLCHEDRLYDMTRSALGFAGNGTPQRHHLLLSYPCVMAPELVAALVAQARMAFCDVTIKHSFDSFSYLVIWAEW